MEEHRNTDYPNLPADRPEVEAGDLVEAHRTASVERLELLLPLQQLTPHSNKSSTTTA